jgi:ABC-type nitrate/sulfonate/bicarbonate transport system ATPase subunit
MTSVIPLLPEKNESLAVQIKELRTWYKNLEVLHDISLSIKPGEAVSIIGPSGCGKSTFLNTVAGTLKDAHVEGEIKVYAERVGYVFQEDTLLPWRTVKSNILLPYEILDLKPDVKRTQNLIEVAGLKGFEDYYPSQLSGGMKQRVELIRDIIINPDLLLLDEPLGALDAYTRIKMQIFLYKLMEELKNTTIILVTHDIEEALILSERIVILSNRPARIIREVRIGRCKDPMEARTTKGFQDKKKGILEILYGGGR